MRIYRGERTNDGCKVTVDDDLVFVNPNRPGSGTRASRPLNPRFDLKKHSPTGFEWSYGGSGPAQLALAILADLKGPEYALQHYQAFKFKVIAKLNGDSWAITSSDIEKVLAEIATTSKTDGVSSNP